MAYAEEDDIRIDFPTAVSVRKFDDTAIHGLSHCMKAVDFIIELSDKILFVEIKDPENPNAGACNRKEFIENLKSYKLINTSLIPKCRDSFLYEYCMERVHKPIHYYVIVALDSLSEAELINQSDLLAKYIPVSGPPTDSWRKRFIQSSHIFNLKTWNAYFSEYPITRISTCSK